MLLLAIPPAALALWMAGWTGSQPPAYVDFLWALLVALPWAAGWLASAWGYGWAIAHAIAPKSHHATALQVGLGVATFLFLDTTLSSLGFMQVGGSIGAWVVLVAGLVLLVARAAMTKPNPATQASTWHKLAWLAAAPALATLIIAACSAPGWLWRTEFGGYDALSYHLQLPREWLHDGSLQGYTHNVYSFFPSYVESAYYHLAVLVGDGVHSAYAAQLLHAGMTIIAAWITATVAMRLAGQIAGFFAFAAMLGTPWAIVTGSLGYNDMVVVLLLATGLLALTDEQVTIARRMVALGFISGVACGAKLTAIGFVALPLGAAALTMVPRRMWIGGALLGAVAFIAALLPYLIRNVLETGNPLFPFATEALGQGHWTELQSQTWSLGHHTPGGIGTRLAALWNQFLRFGIGANPDPNEPWLPQWSILPALGIAGLAIALAKMRLHLHAFRLIFIVLIQIAFWIFFTHLKSRFLLPTALPLSLGVGLGVAAIACHCTAKNKVETQTRRIGGLAVAMVLGLAWCVIPMLVFAKEPNPAARVGRVEYFTGELLTADERAALADASGNYAINSLAPSSRTLLVGEAAPFYITRPIVYQTTWDRGPMSIVMREHPDDPRAWMSALKAQGFTHLFVNPGMLLRWEAAGWNDPLITMERVMSAAHEFDTPIVNTPTGTLFQLK